MLLHNHHGQPHTTSKLPAATGMLSSPAANYLLLLLLTNDHAATIAYPRMQFLARADLGMWSADFGSAHLPTWGVPPAMPLWGCSCL